MKYMPDLNKTIYGARGQRKQKISLQTMTFLLIGFIIAAWVKVDFQLYLCYAAGCLGLNTAFMWGNVKENQSDASIITAGKTPLQ